MFALEDFVLHQPTGRLGKVIGYGHQILNGVYMTTLKVLVSEASDCEKKSFVEEDLYSAWTQAVKS